MPAGRAPGAGRAEPDRHDPDDRQDEQGQGDEGDDPGQRDPRQGPPQGLGAVDGSPQRGNSERRTGDHCQQRRQASPVARGGMRTTTPGPAVVRRPTTVLGDSRRLGGRRTRPHRPGRCRTLPEPATGPDTDVGAGQQCGSGADSAPSRTRTIPRCRMPRRSSDPVPRRSTSGSTAARAPSREHAGDRWEGVQIDAGPEAASEQSHMEGDEGEEDRFVAPSSSTRRSASHTRRWTLPPQGYSRQAGCRPSRPGAAGISRIRPSG